MRRWSFFASALLLLASSSQPSWAAEFKGHAFFIVFPDYPVNTDSFYGYTNQVGHAGVLLVNQDGLTKYYEYGRYDEDKNGVVKNRIVPNVTMKNGKPTEESLVVLFAKLSDVAGKGARIRAAHFIDMDYQAMNRFAQAGKFSKYSVSEANCGHFAEAIILKGNSRIDRPSIVNFTPNNFVDEYIEEGNAEILFDPSTKELKIGEGDEADAKTPVK